MLDNDGFEALRSLRKIVDYSPELERAVKARAEVRKLLQKKETNTAKFVGSFGDKDIIADQN